MPPADSAQGTLFPPGWGGGASSQSSIQPLDDKDLAIPGLGGSHSQPTVNSFDPQNLCKIAGESGDHKLLIASKLIF